MEKETDGQFVKEVISSCDSHIKKYGYRKMSLKELDKLFEKSKLTQKDAIEIGRSIKMGIAKRHSMAK